MFTATQPLHLTASAQYANGTLQFDTCRMLLRYQRVPGLPTAMPTFHTGQTIEPPWKITEVPTTPPRARIFKLTLHGTTFNGFIANDPEHPLYVAFLDQATIKLQLNVGPLPPPADDPSCAADLLVTLYLKLQVIVR